MKREYETNKNKQNKPKVKSISLQIKNFPPGRAISTADSAFLRQRQPRGCAGKVGNKRSLLCLNSSYCGRKLCERFYILRYESKDHPYPREELLDSFCARKLEDGAIEILSKKDGKVVEKQIRRLTANGHQSAVSLSTYQRKKE